MGERLWEVDALRGTGAIMMVAYHLLWDLSFLGLWGGDAGTGWGGAFALMVGTVFLGTAGISLSIYRGRGGKLPVKRSFRLLAIGLVITLVTLLVFPQQAIWFGVLHCIALSLLVVYPIAGRPYYAAAAGSAMVVAGTLLSTVHVGTPFLIWLGPTPLGLSTMDLYPLLPWAGVMALGASAGAVLYPRGERKADRPAPQWSRPLSALGRRSLPIYLFHQPVLFLLLLPVSHFML